MNQEQIDNLIRENGGPFIFDRMFRAVEKVRERLERACAALEKHKVPYAVVGGNAVAAWVATVDEGAVRNTRDVDILLNRQDIDRATVALQEAGFHREVAMGSTLFLDGPDGTPSQGVRILWAAEKVRPEYVDASPLPSQSQNLEGMQIVEMERLVSMKLNSYRRKDQVHLLDLIGVGLVDEAWPARFSQVLSERLQELLDDPDS